MLELRLTRKEIIALPTEDKELHRAIMKSKLKEKGFDLSKRIETHMCRETKDLIYLQSV